VTSEKCTHHNFEVEAQNDFSEFGVTQFNWRLIWHVSKMIQQWT